MVHISGSRPMIRVIKKSLQIHRSKLVHQEERGHSLFEELSVLTVV